MTEHDQPVFRGTPDQWWEQAEQITEAEAADRHFGSWYIVAEMRGGVPTDTYRVSRTTKGSNEQRRNALRAGVAKGTVHADDISKRVRLLIRVQVSEPEWMAADLVMADREEGSAERTPWRRNRNGRWTQLFGGLTVSGQTMQTLHPVVASITEG